jgi:hypothetical protein
VQPDRLILNGDILDCTGIGKYSKNPDQVDVLEEEIGVGQRLIKLFQHSAGFDRKPIEPGKPRTIYTVGNHEDRLRRYLQTQAPALKSLSALQWDRLLEFSETDVELCEDELLLAQGRLSVFHGHTARKIGGMSAWTEAANRMFGVSVYMNHTHRQGFVPFTSHYPGVDKVEEVGGAYEGGCMQDMHHPDLFIRRPNWQYGMGIINVSDDRFDVELLKFLGNSRNRWVVYRGNLIRA